MSKKNRLNKFLGEANPAQARAEMSIVFQNLEQIIDDAVADAEDKMLDLEDVLERKIFIPAVKDMIKELDDAGNAAEGTWVVQSKAVDKFIQDQYRQLVKMYGKESPIANAFWTAVEDIWFER